jgi:hypothetical protein
MLNWRPVREIEQRTREIEIAIWREQQRQEQIENEIRQSEREDELLEKEYELLEREYERIEREEKRVAEQIKNETEQLRKENARLRQLNAKTQHLISCVDQLCFLPDSSSTPALPTASDGKPSSP